MTKTRAPLTYENALARIAGQIGWAAMAQATGRAERTVRNWGDPDASEACPIDCAELLDIAYQAGGGEGAPLFDTYQSRFKAARAERFADELAISNGAHKLAKEGGEAIAALILAGRPGATMKDKMTALRETEELAAAVQATLPLLTEGNGPDADSVEGKLLGGVG